MNDDFVLFRGTAEEFAKVELLIYDSDNNLVTTNTAFADSSGEWTLVVNNYAHIEGVFSIKVQQTDLAGNTGPPSTSYPFEGDYTSPYLADSTPNDNFFDTSLYWLWISTTKPPITATHPKNSDLIVVFTEPMDPITTLTSADLNIYIPAWTDNCCDNLAGYTTECISTDSEANVTPVDASYTLSTDGSVPIVGEIQVYLSGTFLVYLD